MQAPCENPFSIRPTSSCCFLNRDWVSIVYLMTTYQMTKESDPRLMVHVDRTIAQLTLRGDWPRC